MCHLGALSPHSWLLSCRSISNCTTVLLPSGHPAPLSAEACSACYFPTLPPGSHPGGKQHMLATTLGTVHPLGGWGPALLQGGSGDDPRVCSWDAQFPQVSTRTDIISNKGLLSFFLNGFRTQRTAIYPSNPSNQKRPNSYTSFTSKLWPVLWLSPTLSLHLWSSCHLLTHGWL